MRKAFLKAPLNYTRISSGFSLNRFHPILKRSRPHLGVDYAAPTGTPIRTIGDGTVIDASFTKGNGRFVKIRHNSTYATQYLHMSKFAQGMRVGKVVKQGDVIGYVGSTGLATGPHLCFRFWQNGRQVNPRGIEAPAVEPISEDMKPAFMAVADVVRSRLDKINLPVEEEDTLPKEMASL
ncbi:MAG: M23 family metallopeptidase [Bacteroidia bacterium]